jgi:RHS repeat-associated protein
MKAPPGGKIWSRTFGQILAPFYHQERYCAFSPISGSIACKIETIKLLDYRARYYDPALGRFISPDTIVPDSANPQSRNRFSYVYNNPLRYNDPTGHVVNAPPRVDGIWNKTAPTESRQKAWKNRVERRRAEKVAAEEAKAAEEEVLRKLFDPYTGPLQGSPSWEEAQGQAFEDRMRDAGQGLYGESGVNLWEVALAPLDNPLNEAVDNPGHPLCKTVESYEWMNQALIGNSVHIPYNVFLQELNLGTEVSEYPWNYEPNYLEALMLAHPEELESAKEYYRDNFPKEYNDKLLDYLFGNTDV